jgi:demethylmenaquinone methyltransferase/2-methoxy-6-polyprenyl-1,4-benzoquinol methylase
MQVTIGSWRLTVERSCAQEQGLTAMYDRAAATWQQAMQRLGYQQAYQQLFADLRERNVLPAITAATRILDCGIGTGALSVALASVCPGLARIDGVDLSSAMLQRAAANLAGIGVNLNGRQVSAERLPFADGEFDLVMAAHLLEHLPEPTRALTELLRVLQPGGVLILLINRSTFWTQWIQLRWRFVIHPAAQIAATLAKLDVHEATHHRLTGRLPSRTSTPYVIVKQGVTMHN